MSKETNLILYRNHQRLKSKLAEITELCEAEIESKGRFDANQKILEILEVIQG
jgi:hypothetical protein